MRTPPIVPPEEFGEAALLFDAVGRRTQVDPFVLHVPPQALDEDVIVATPASVHADLDPVISQHLRELVAGELRAPRFREGRLWSVLKISGLPNRASASPSAST